ncbi:hypothetical protein I4U23_014910 [Adineta vaga]|nr:hypothetical protein I4U23_014910 [Adineta vaga]
MQTASTSSAKAVWPIAAICCLALIFFVISAAIVLALIPVYLPRKDITPAENLDKSNDPFYLEYAADGFDDDDNAIAGDLEDPDTLGKSMGFTDDAKVESGIATPSSTDRRKRSFFGLRPKRAITVKILLIVKFIATTCNTQCLAARKKFRTGLDSSKTFSNIKITINGGPLGRKIATIRLKFVGLVRARPSGFRGAPSSDEFTSIKSGEFTDTSIWGEEILPSGNCSIVIAAGTVVTLSRPGLGIKARLITIYGTLIIGGGNTAFTFKNAVNIKVRKGGKIQDATSTKTILVPRNSVVFLYLGGGFAEAGTTIQAYSSSGVGESFKITNPAGPFTCAILPSGTLRQASKITFYAVVSGSFKSGSSYCGGSAPTVDDCTDSPCGLEVTAGCTLSTADLNGSCDINFDVLTIAAGAILELGTPGSTAGFKFKFPIQLISAGTLSFVASGGGILLAIGSTFTISAGGKFMSIVETFLQVYDPVTGVLGAIRVLATLITEAFSVTISSSGIFIDVIIGGSTVSGSASTLTTTTVSPSVAPG